VLSNDVAAREAAWDSHLQEIGTQQTHLEPGQLWFCWGLYQVLPCRSHSWQPLNGGRSEATTLEKGQQCSLDVLKALLGEVTSVQLGDDNCQLFDA